MSSCFEPSSTKSSNSPLRLSIIFDASTGIGAIQLIKKLRQSLLFDILSSVKSATLIVGAVV